MAKHFTDTSLTAERKQAQIRIEARLDGIYAIRTPVPAGDLGAAGVVTACKNLKYVERDFRHIKSDDLDLRPVFHRLERRRQAHVLICMLAAYLTWHLRQAWAPLTCTGEEPPGTSEPRRPRTAPGIGPGARRAEISQMGYRSISVRLRVPGGCCHASPGGTIASPGGHHRPAAGNAAWAAQ